MKLKYAIVIIAVMFLFILTLSYEKSFAVENEKNNTASTNSKIVELKEKELVSLENYEEEYNSKSYGLTAYILHKVQVYSIPVCFLLIVIAAIHSFVLGIRHIESGEKGLALMVSFITIGVICQVLPLVFTIVVKFGRE